MVKFKDFSWPLGVFQVLFKASLIFKTVLYIQVLFKHVRTLETTWSGGHELRRDLFAVGDFQLDLAFNLKLAIENFCSSHELMFLGSLYCKQHGPRSDSVCYLEKI